MEGFESPMLGFILKQTMRMTYEKSLAYLLWVFTGLFNNFSFSVGIEGFLTAVSLLSCVFHASPRFPEVSSGSAPSDIPWEGAFIFSPQRAAHVPGWSSNESESWCAPSNKMLQVSKTRPPVVIHIYTFLRLIHNVRQWIFCLIPYRLCVTPYRKM